MIMIIIILLIIKLRYTRPVQSYPPFSWKKHLALKKPWWLEKKKKRGSKSLENKKTIKPRR